MSWNDSPPLLAKEHHSDLESKASILQVQRAAPEIPYGTVADALSITNLQSSESMP